MAKKRRKQRGTDTPDDAFVAWLLTLSTWAGKHTRTLTVVGIAVALAAGAGVYYYNYRQNLEVQAAQEFTQVENAFNASTPDSAVTALRTFVQRYGSTPYATEASLLLAELHLRQGRAQDAINLLEPRSQDLSDPLSLQAAFLLGTAYENAGRTEDAEKLYLRIADQAGLTFQVRDALTDAARIRAENQDYAGAASLYQRVLDSYAQDSTSTQPAAAAQRRQIELRLAEMKAAQERSDTRS